jgi:NAD(P)-dependent dehydrogenase (short-subunit alcohol dehydrogenase family)
MDLGFSGASVVVTGGASHIGQAIVWAFAAEGARIAIVDKDVKQARATAEGARARGAAETFVVGADLADHEEAGRACAEVLQLLGSVDVLVTNVGWNRPAFFLDYDPAQWDHLLHVNLSAAMSCVHALLPSMIERRRGSIVATASTAAFGEQRQSVYAAAKAGLVAFMKTIALEYGRFGIRANLVAPGLVLPAEGETLGEQSLWQDREAIMNDAQTKYVLDRTPLRRLSAPEDIANSTLFLASEKTSRQLTGQMLTVSGGFAMR